MLAGGLVGVGATILTRAAERRLTKPAAARELLPAPQARGAEGCALGSLLERLLEQL